MPKSPAKLSEAHIERTCSEWLALDGWRRVITDPKRLRGLGVTEKGIPDGLYLRYAGYRDRSPIWASQAQVMWIEWKRSLVRGGQFTKASKDQFKWHHQERSCGGFTLIAGIDFPATIEGFQKWYRESGLMRRQLR